jgi:hypothetical protein
MDASDDVDVMKNGNSSFPCLESIHDSSVFQSVFLTLCLNDIPDPSENGEKIKNINF